jgi:putative DNA-invertase from lambdoid prophage Rac
MAMRVFGYSRVSTSEQADEGVSLAAQAQQIAGYAMMKGWTVAEHFVERGVSGSIPLADRPEGQRLLAAIGKGDVVVSAKLDRAFRSAADALAVLEEFKDQGVGLHLIDLGGDVTGNGVSKMVFTILAAVAEGERDRIRERIRDAKRHLTAQRIFSGGSRPFGYDIVQDGETRRMVPNPAEMAVIERMQAMRKAGATYRAIGAVTGHGPKSAQRILERMAKSAPAA